MTEDEARQKWCPMVREGGAVFVSNRSSAQQHAFNCIASDCMMWRWRKPGFDGVPSSDKTKGYCGLAGKP